MSASALLAEVYQRAYVTSDLHWAQKIFRDRFGVESFATIQDFHLDVTTPAGPAHLRQNLAFAWVGEIQIELIEPISDHNGFYRDILPTEGFALARHHYSVRVLGQLDAWLAYREQLSIASPILIEGGLGKAVRFAFVDYRQTIGCYLEAAWHGPNGEGLPRHVPHHPARLN